MLGLRVIPRIGTQDYILATYRIDGDYNSYNTYQHLSAYHITSYRLSLGLRVYFSLLFLDPVPVPVSLLVAYQQFGDHGRV